MACVVKYDAAGFRSSETGADSCGILNHCCRTGTHKNGSKLGASANIGIYTGTGASHSWLWFVDLFEKSGFTNVYFLDEADFSVDVLSDMDVLAISGGDTFAIAEALGPEGARHLDAFITGGGLYLGSCAGAYLPMNSSKAPLHHFNFIGVKITNLRKVLPPALVKSHKFAMAYGCDFIFHPVREAVLMELSKPFSPDGRHVISAPLYGGPGMTVSDGSVEILARYCGFTPKTTFLVDREIAEETLLNTAAVVKVSRGLGRMYLFGPHFEHPGYPEANSFIIKAIDTESRLPSACDRRSARTNYRSASNRGWIHAVKRELSNARIVSAGMDILPMAWLIGHKIYEPEKIRVFIEAMWRRIRILEKRSPAGIESEDHDALLEYACETVRLLRKMKQMMDSRKETTEIARNLFMVLRRFSACFFNNYFQTISYQNATRSML